MAIGVDIEDIERFKNKSEEFIQRIFTAVEIDYCQKFSKPESHYAARFAQRKLL